MAGHDKKTKQRKYEKQERSRKGDQTDVVPRKTDKKHKGHGEAPLDDELREAIKKAKDLSSNIKDIRDELNILKATAQYQRDVQEGVYKDQVLRADLSAAHVVNDIREMDSVADRIQAALPLSFLSSLFALDVASFQQAPAWAFAVIFSVSIAIFIPLTGAAMYSERVAGFTSKLFEFVRDSSRIEGKDDESDLSTKESSRNIRSNRNKFMSSAPSDASLKTSAVLEAPHADFPMRRQGVNVRKQPTVAGTQLAHAGFGRNGNISS
ncbi:hypothetical protein Daus18300_003286 [Diaporthe australafricana]|uniref:Uncharacterized protein n=1 Tax=Diaporthe australafricana TaxID=127596 RepID=A0ABR3XGY4_9PEZI